ncbi:MCE family protein [Phycicoccus sonneratiae]|uniref:MCE family protein n=1 Tax=Phycicoccus sonneratiae TaxID=2807628 RepID=A0ABS2CJW2_9MICO|nr:MCE family protein [Phycicoccus sonneraticus]MBM6400133.1 MCE family protein [Phycicoccus sonneraticus]
MTRRTRTAVTALVSALALVVLAGCSSVYDLPLPGGPGAEGRQISVRAEFADVLDLVPRSSVKIDEVTVGEVTDIELDGWTARVTMRIPAASKLPDDTRAELKQTSLLGEKYVALERPEGGGTGSLADGDLIPLERTGRNPEVEEVLAALSMLLNGGGVGQLKIIESELNDAMRGNHEEIDSLITQLDTFVGGLDEQKAEIIRAIDGIDRLSASLAERKDQLAAVLQELPKGLAILADQREQLTRMLTALSRLGKVGSTVIEASRDDVLANLAALKPILAQLNAAGDDLPKSLQLLLTYPFPDSSLQAIKGDYTNLRVTADLDLRNLTLPTPTGLPLPSVPVPSLPIPSLPVPTITVPLPSLPVPTPSLPLPTKSGGPLCPPICIGGASASSAAGEDMSWTTLYTGGQPS